MQGSGGWNLGFVLGEARACIPASRSFSFAVIFSSTSPPAATSPSTPSHPTLYNNTANMSAPDPKEAWQRIQTELARRSQRFGAGGGGPPKGTLGGIGGIVVLAGGIWLANNALFNGV